MPFGVITIELAEVKGRDDDSVRINQAAKVGYVLRNFRLRGKKNSTGHMAYERQAAITCLSAHVPRNPPNSPQPPSQNTRGVQRGNGATPDGTEATEGFGFQPPEIASASTGIFVRRPFASTMTIDTYPLVMDVPVMQRVSDAMYEFRLIGKPFNIAKMIQPESGEITAGS